MNSKILLIIVILAVGFGAFTLLGNKKTMPTPTTSTQKVIPVVTETINSEVTNITLTDSGFMPKDITVKSGTRLIWINKSGKSATVSSDDHPTHRLYTFLNLGKFEDGSSVQVVVDTVGKYSYHDHLNATSTGTVTVE